MTMTRTAAIYCRISRDRVGAGLGVERQEADCRELADRLGWTVAAVHVDNDISAYSGKVRPAYRALLSQLRDGTVDAVVSWHPDRLHRRAVELEEFVGLCEDRDVSIQTVRAGEVDLSTASGRMVARMLGAAAQHEIDPHTKDSRCTSPLVMTSATGLPLDYSTMGAAFKLALDLAGIEERTTLHDLRHTFASWLIQDGVPIRTVQVLLGHGSVTVTERYAHLNREQYDQVRDVLDGPIRDE